MRTLLQFIVLIMGGVLVLSGCASVADEPIAQVEETIAPTIVHTQVPQSDVDEVSEESTVDNESVAQAESTSVPTTVSTEMIPTTEPAEVANDEVVEADIMSNGFIFYDSHATW